MCTLRNRYNLSDDDDDYFDAPLITYGHGSFDDDDDYSDDGAPPDEGGHDPEADRVADQSADASAPGKRKTTGLKKKAKKRKGGYTDKGRLGFKAEGGVLATSPSTAIPVTGRMTVGKGPQ
eukprot:7102254-Prymnesium_polylepis.2